MAIHRLAVLDCGASISLIKLSSLSPETMCTMLDKPWTVVGLGDGIIKIEYFKYLTFFGNTRQPFFIIKDNINLEEDGILGCDFFVSQGAAIDFKKNILSLGRKEISIKDKIESKIVLKGNHAKAGTCVNNRNLEIHAEAGHFKDNRNNGNLKGESDQAEADCLLSNNKFALGNHAKAGISKVKEEKLKTLGFCLEDLDDHESESNSDCCESDDESSDSGNGSVAGRKRRTRDRDDGSCSDMSTSESADESVIDVRCSSQSGELRNKVKIAKQTICLAKVKIQGNGDGFVSEMKFQDGVFSLPCVVNVLNGEAKIPFVNYSNVDVEVAVPVITVEKFDFGEKSDGVGEEIRIFKINPHNRHERLLKEIDLSHLNFEEKQQVEELLTEFSDVFFLDGDKLESNVEFEHEIQLKENAKPVKVKQWKVPFALKTEMDKSIKDLLSKDLIETCETPSEWNMPVMLVPKKSLNGERRYRMVVDLRKLNELVVTDSYPIPNMDEILGQLGKAQYFSTMDLYSGFYQIGLAEGSRKLTSFSANTDKYRFKRLPMGMKNSPSVFMRMMSKVFSELIGIHCFVYLDDISTAGASLKEEMTNLKKIFMKMREHHLKMEPKKCEFLKKETLFLGHEIIPGVGIFPDSSKFEAIRNFPQPKNSTQMKRFLGLCGYYRKFIQDYGKIAGILNKLTSPNFKKWFVWTDAHTIAFEALKQKVITPPVLIFPDFTQEFELHCDASGQGISGILAQRRDGLDRPIEFASREMSQREKIQTIDRATEKELLAIAWSVKHFRKYLLGRKFTIFTDHKPLIYLNSMCNDSTYLMKYKAQLAEYDFVIKYKKGKENSNADALSRMFSVYCADEELREKLIRENHESAIGAIDVLIQQFIELNRQVLNGRE